MPSPICRIPSAGWRSGGTVAPTRSVPEETAIAFTYNRSAHAVMMATPADLEDLAIGFSLNERIIQTPGEIEELDIVPVEHGIELRMWIGDRRIAAFYERRRFLAGPSGCGLCGIESLADAMRPPSIVRSSLQIPADAVLAAMAALPAAQKLNRDVRALHAAAFWDLESGLVALREDIGRHNALDKLAGALARGEIAAGGGIILLTSRISVELIQKAAAMGAPCVVAISAPTALAVRVAAAAGITLAAVARADGFETFTHASRILGPEQ
jgi:FdhD protein